MRELLTLPLVSSATSFWAGLKMLWFNQLHQGTGLTSLHGVRRQKETETVTVTETVTQTQTQTGIQTGDRDSDRRQLAETEKDNELDMNKDIA